MNICYFSTLAPCGKGETFVLNEITEVMRRNNNVTVIPVRPEFRYNEKHFNVWCLNPFGFKCFIFAAKMFLTSPKKCFSACFDMLFKAGGIKKGIKNSIFFGKALASAWYLKNNGNFDFIHAHWLATTSSVAYVASKITGIPFGITGHRFDVYENNGIKQKASLARFIRLIDNRGKERILSLVAEADKKKVVCIHLGIDIDENNEYKDVLKEKKESFLVCVPANLIPVKGHKYIIEAFKILKERNINNIKCVFYGEGELKNELEEEIKSSGLTDAITFGGYIINSALIQKYNNREIDAVLLASIDMGGGMHEGIPVCLMEAMAFKIPVISTNTGGIPELLDGGAGCMIKEKSAVAIANGIEKLLFDDDYYTETAFNGYKRVKNSFNNDKNTEQILNLMRMKAKNTGSD